MTEGEIKKVGGGKVRGDFPETVPHGECECGCGEKTKIAISNHTKKGHIVGRPIRFIRGHHRANWKGGRTIEKRKYTNYIKLRIPEHPRSHNSYVYEHILVAEKMTGAPLPNGAVVHHIDGNGLNNNEDNLTICPNIAYHNQLHAKQDKLTAQRQNKGD